MHSKVYIGSDIKTTVTLTDEATGVAYNLASATGVEVAIYQQPGKVLQTAKLSASRVTIDDAAAGILSAYFDRSATDDMDVGSVFIDVRLTVTNANYQGGVQHVIVAGTKIGDAVRSVFT